MKNGKEDCEDEGGHGVGLHMFLRVLILGIAELLALALALISIAGIWRTKVTDLLIASRSYFLPSPSLIPNKWWLMTLSALVPAIVLVIFATQRVRECRNNSDLLANACLRRMF